jgi:STE24 endopeptidase
MISSNIFLISFYTFAIIGLIIKLILNFKNVSYIAKHSRTVPKMFEEKITLKEHKIAAKYTITKSNFSTATMIIHFLLLMLWVPTGGLNQLDTYVQSFNLSQIQSGLIFFLLYMIISTLISLPESIYSTFVIEEKFGFNKTTPKLFCIDFMKQILLSTILGGILIYALLFLMNFLGKDWWIYAWTFIILFQFLIIWAYPKFIAPLFNKFSPLEDEDLKIKIENLSTKIDLNFKDYYIMNASLRSSHGNAYFTGFGKNKRIVFFDTLLKTLTNNEVMAVLAHELGHLKKKHILKSLFRGIIFMGIGFYILGLLLNSSEFFLAFGKAKQSSHMALILFSFLLPIYTFLLTPISSWLSRRNEYEADQFAVENTDGDELISALVKMYKDNSSSLTPSPMFSKFYYSHPPAIERVNFINSVKSK